MQYTATITLNISLNLYLHLRFTKFTDKLTWKQLILYAHGFQMSCLYGKETPFWHFSQQMS
jgi:hypothetical protein